MSDTYNDYIKVGIDRNMVVFDNDALPGRITQALLDMINQVAQENNIILESINIPMGIDRIFLNKYYLDQRGSFPTGKNNIIIGIGPLHGSKLCDEGQDDRHVLLGCY